MKDLTVESLSQVDVHQWLCIMPPCNIHTVYTFRHIRAESQNVNTGKRILEDSMQLMYHRMMHVQAMYIHGADTPPDALKLLDREPGNIQARLSRGLRLKELGEDHRDAFQLLHGAIQDFSQVLELDEHNKAALRNRGIVWLKLSYYPDAIADLKIALDLEDKLCLQRCVRQT